MPEIITTNKKRVLKEYNISMLVVAGSCNYTTIKFNNNLLQLIVSPTTQTTIWHLEITHLDGTIWRKLPETGTYTGWKQFTATFPLIDEQVLKLSSVSANEIFMIKFIYD